MKPRINIYLAGGMLQGISTDTPGIDAYVFIADEEDSDEWDMAVPAPIFMDINDVTRSRARAEADDLRRD